MLGELAKGALAQLALGGLLNGYLHLLGFVIFSPPSDDGLLFGPFGFSGIIERALNIFLLVPLGPLTSVSIELIQRYIPGRYLWIRSML